jgi:hypothetical protein
MQQFKDVSTFSIGQTIRFNYIQPKIHFFINLLLLNLTKKFNLALTSDLFDVLLPLVHGTKSDFLGKATPCSKGQNCQIAKIFRDNCSEKQYKRTTVQKDCKNEWISPYLYGADYARPLIKSNQS